MTIRQRAINTAEQFCREHSEHLLKILKNCEGDKINIAISVFNEVGLLVCDVKELKPIALSISYSQGRACSMQIEDSASSEYVSYKLDICLQ